MVAACIKAETGVGPSIASGSQTWRGSWADFPTAPQNTQRRAAPRTPAEIVAGISISENVSVPVIPHIIRMPIMKPKSPIRFVRKAFFAASAAESF